MIHFPKRAKKEGGNGVISSSLDSFLKAGKLYRCEYAASSALLLAKRGGTCTTATSDATDLVIHRAKYLLNHGFGRYNLFRNNCENFAIYCKTGLLILDDATVGQSGQIVSYVSGAATLGLVAVAGVLIAASAPVVLGEMAVIFAAGVSTEIFVLSCAKRCGSDIGKKKNVLKIPVEDLVKEAKVHLASFKRDAPETLPDPMLLCATR